MCTVYMGVRMKCVFMYVECNKYILGNGRPAVLEPEARSNDGSQIVFARRRCSYAVSTTLT
jgi:hypothetical protein